MRQNFFSHQELMAMPLGKLRRLDLQSPDEEAVVQEIVDARMGSRPMEARVMLRKDLDITTQEQEARWEKELAQRVSQMRAPSLEVPTAVGDPTPAPVAQPQPVVEEPTPTPQPVEAKVKRVSKPRVLKIKN